MHDDAVEQLGLVGRQLGGQGQSTGAFGVGRVQRPGHRLLHRHLLQQRGHLLQRAGRRQAQLAQPVHRGQYRLAVAPGQRLHQPDSVAAINRAQHRPHTGLVQPAGAKGDGLVGER